MEQVKTQPEVILGSTRTLTFMSASSSMRSAAYRGLSRLRQIPAATSSCWIGRKASACCVGLELKGLAPTVLD